MTDASCGAAEAVARAQRISKDSTLDPGPVYWLGSGDYAPFYTEHGGLVDFPWTSNEAAEKAGYHRVSDCAGFAICWCWKLRRHRPGFNKGPWASVEDDINVNSAMEDAVHHQELFEEVHPSLVRPGDLLCYPTIKLKGFKQPFIGHVSIVLDISPKYVAGAYSKLLVAHCHGPNGRRPAVTQNMGLHWEERDKQWPKPEHRTHVIRPKERP